jgi:hypothetical protein
MTQRTAATSAPIRQFQLLATLVARGEGEVGEPDARHQERERERPVQDLPRELRGPPQVDPLRHEGPGEQHRRAEEEEHHAQEHGANSDGPLPQEGAGVVDAVGGVERLAHGHEHVGGRPQRDHQPDGEGTGRGLHHHLLHGVADQVGRLVRERALQGDGEGLGQLLAAEEAGERKGHQQGRGQGEEGEEGDVGALGRDVVVAGGPGDPFQEAERAVAAARLPPPLRWRGKRAPASAARSSPGRG